MNEQLTKNGRKCDVRDHARESEEKPEVLIAHYRFFNTFILGSR